jgi:hypothetical protein
VVTARQDLPKRELLEDLGLIVTARWWVKELAPAESASVYGEVDLGSATGLFVPAPPVYDPGGPVCLLGDIDASLAGDLAEEAERQGAVLAVIDRSPQTAATNEPALERHGFHNPSEFFEGTASSDS